MGLFSFSFALMHILLLLSMFQHTLAGLQPLCQDDERSALLQFKQSLTVVQCSFDDYPSAYPKVASWSQEEENSDCCLWNGIKCNEDTGHVIRLDLTSSCLHGSINSSSSLFQLVHLELLVLSNNHFNFSEIPSEIKNLSRLTALSLSNSSFSGQIPAELLELSKLESLDLSFNNFHLKLQNPSLANLADKLANLKVLHLGQVNIASTVPHALANLSSLFFLSLTDCLLQGEFPAEIFQLPKLAFLTLTYNHYLTGYLPEFQNSSVLIDLRLSHMRFSGKIPDSIENLESLDSLGIRGCSFSGKLPPSVGNLTKLNHLYLSGNDFSGELPASLVKLSSLKTLEIILFNFSGKVPDSLSNLTQMNSLTISVTNFSEQNSYSLSWIPKLNQLTYLDLSGSKITGEMLCLLSNLTELTQISLVHNQLTGPIPFCFMNLNKLSTMYLHNNQLTGHIPVEVKKLTQLQILLLSSNKFSLLTGTNVSTNLPNFTVIGFRSCNISEFPYFLHNQDQLVSLDLSSNKIAGQVPQWLLNVSTKSLEYLNFSDNLLSGFGQDLFVLPWSKMNTLDLGFNNLQGPLPVPSSVSIYSYLVSNNQLTGEIPIQICSLNGLHALDLSYNNLSGMLPECFANNFYGIIPQTFMNGTNLMMIDFSENSLQGRVPKSLANCVKLKFLNLGDNQITDVFPSWLGTLPELEVLILKFNNFHGEIEEPQTGFEFPKLRIIDLSHNRFTGNLPSKHFHCWNAMKDIRASKLTYLQVKLVPYDVLGFTYYGYADYSLIMSNKGTEIEYPKLSNLIAAIILSDNNFVGEIPTSIASLKGLRTLTLSNNNLRGYIPLTLSNLTVIESLDLSSNKLTGQIPQGAIPQGTQFITFTNDWFAGNPGLCGEPLSRKCGNSEASPAEDDPPSESVLAFGWKIVLAGYASGTIIGVVLGHIFCTRKYEWLIKTFRLQPESNGRRRTHRHRM
ncbi:hypothetical protein CICLE_v10018209mg [Citrus x clementina]|uniref:Uncharacterized protein n=1 Tax=Citrus clementina TaxID=85681 RepID=V4U510_CITCL|nr:hypothetical protein CICLE_v10018209mg [Citrus x clementina]